MAERNVQYLLQTFRRLHCLQREGTLCDLVLISNDDAQFRVHTSVLAAASKSFYTLLLQKGSLKKIRLMNINGTSLAMLIRFIYGEHLSADDELKTLTQALTKLGMKDLFNFIGLSISEDDDVNRSTSDLSPSNVQFGSTTNKTDAVVENTDKQSITANQIEGDSTVPSKGGNSDRAAGSDNSENGVYVPVSIKSEPMSPEPWDDHTDDLIKDSDVKLEINNSENKNYGNHGNQTHKQLQQPEEASGRSDPGNNKSESVGHRDTDSAALRASYLQQSVLSNELRPVGLFRNDSLIPKSTNLVYKKLDNSEKKVTIDNCEKSTQSSHWPHLQHSTCQPTTQLKDSANPVISPKKISDNIPESTGKEGCILPQTTVTKQVSSCGMPTNAALTKGGAVSMNTCTSRQLFVPKSKFDKDIQKKCQATCKRVRVLLRPVDNRGNYAIFPATSDPANDYLNPSDVQNCSSSNNIDNHGNNIPEMTTQNPEKKDCVSRDHSGANKRHLQQEQTPASQIVASLQNIVITPSGQVLAFPVQPVPKGSAVDPHAHVPTTPFRNMPRKSVTDPKCETVNKRTQGQCIPPKRKNALDLGSPKPSGDAKNPKNNWVSSEPIQDCASKRMKLSGKSVMGGNEKISKTTGESMTASKSVEPADVPNKCIDNENIEKPEKVAESEVKIWKRISSEDEVLRKCSSGIGVEAMTSSESEKDEDVPKECIDNKQVVKADEVANSEVVAKIRKRRSSKRAKRKKYSSKELSREENELIAGIGEDSNEILIIDLDKSAMDDDFSCGEWPSTDSEKTDNDSWDKPAENTAVTKSDRKLRSASPGGPDGSSLANQNLAIKKHLLTFINLKMKNNFHAVETELDFFHDQPELSKTFRKIQKRTSEESSSKITIKPPPKTSTKSRNTINSEHDETVDHNRIKTKKTCKKNRTVKDMLKDKKIGLATSRIEPRLRLRASVTYKTPPTSLTSSGSLPHTTSSGPPTSLAPSRLLPSTTFSGPPTSLAPSGHLPHTTSSGPPTSLAPSRLLPSTTLSGPPTSLAPSGPLPRTTPPGPPANITTPGGPSHASCASVTDKTPLTKIAPAKPLASAAPPRPLASATPPGPLASATPPAPLASATPPAPLASATPPGPLASATVPTPPGGPSQALPVFPSNSLWIRLPGGEARRVIIGRDNLHKASSVSSASAVAVQPSAVPIQPSAVAVQSSAVAVRSSPVQIQSSAVQPAVAIQPDAVPIQPVAVRPSPVPIQSSAVRPAAVAVRPSAPSAIAIQPRVANTSSQVVMRLSTVSPMTRYATPAGLSGNPVISGLTAGPSQMLMPNYVVTQTGGQPIRMTTMAPGNGQFPGQQVILAPGSNQLVRVSLPQLPVTGTNTGYRFV